MWKKGKSAGSWDEPRFVVHASAMAMALFGLMVWFFHEFDVAVQVPLCLF